MPKKPSVKKKTVGAKRGASPRAPAGRGRRAKADAPARPAPRDAARAFAIEVARSCRDDKCEDVLVLDVRELSQVTDYIVLASGTSDRQMRSVLRHVQELGDRQGMQAFRSHADERATWLLADFVDVVVHLFEPNIRAHYDLEMLWGDAPRVAWERPDQVDRDRAGLTAGGARDAKA